MRARGTAAFNRAPYKSIPIEPSCRQACRPTRSVTVGLPRVGVFKTVGLSQFVFLQKANNSFLSLGVDTFPTHAFSARPSWSARLPTTRQAWCRSLRAQSTRCQSTACATMKGSGFPKGETLVSPFGGASFGTFLPLVGEKYIKTNKQINPNLRCNRKFTY